MSREHHRQYDAALQKLRAEAEAIQKQAHKFKWQDSLTLVSVLLTAIAFISEETPYVIGCFLASALLICLSVRSHKDWGWWRYGISVGVIVLFSFFSIRAYTKGVQRELALPESDLLPAGESDPPNRTRCAMPANAFRIYAGDSLAYYTGEPPYRFLSTNKVPRFSVEKHGNGLAISTDVFAEDGRTVLARIDKNHFIASTSGEILKRDHPDKSTLIATDKYGKTVLNVHYINESAVKITGTFVYPGTTISIDEHEGSIRGAATYTFHQDCWMETGINSGSAGITLGHQ